MRALEKDRGRRYETANGFAADVLRHLAYEPVQAAPPSRAYRVRKFVRKHRGAVIAASLVVLAVLAGIMGTALGLIRAERSRRAADARAEEIKYRMGISDFLLASAAYDDGNVGLAAERLEKVPANQRRWEWRYLNRLTRGGLFTLYGHTGEVLCVSFSPDGTRIVTGSWDGTAKVWDAQIGMPIIELKGHSGRVSSASFSSDGMRIVTASNDRTAKVWDARTGMPLVELKGHVGPVERASFNLDGTQIVTGSDDRTARVWDARTGRSRLELNGHTAEVYSAAFSPDGTRIVTGSNDGTTKVWDARMGTALLELKGHAYAAFSPDGTRIVTGSVDQTVKVWDALIGTLLVELKGMRAPGRASFSPDGTRIVGASHVVAETARSGEARAGGRCEYSPLERWHPDWGLGEECQRRTARAAFEVDRGGP